VRQEISRALYSKECDLGLGFGFVIAAIGETREPDH
jgi:hypothetical protein